MTRRIRANKLRKKNNNDYLSDLPEEILTMISSKLGIRDAVKTSVLSKRWKYVWINRPDFIFNHFTILGLDLNQLKENWVFGNDVFVRLVDKIMEQRSKGTDRINTFCLRFELGKCFSQSIDEWISCAVQKDVETIDLDFTRFSFHLPPFCYSLHGFERYNFSLLRTASGNEGSLKNLRLAFCNFRGRSSSNKFGSIVSIEFENVNISNFQLKKVLESCHLLEKLVLDSCSKLNIVDCNNNTRLKILSLKKLKLTEIDFCPKNLISLEIDEGSHHLSSLQLKKIIKSCSLLEELTLHNCANLTNLEICDSITPHLKVLSLKSSSFKEIDLCVNNLHTFEYRSKSIDQARFIMEAPKLVNAFISEDKRSWYPVTRTCLALPMLENLVLCLDLSLDVFNFIDPLSKFRNVKQLVLIDLPFIITKLSWVGFIFKCFPKLQTLELNFKTTSFEPHLKGIEMICANRTITKLEMNGFVGSPSQVNLLMYLLETLKGLKVLVIRPSYKHYKKFNCWVSSKAEILGKISCNFDYESTQFNSKWIRTIVPPFVRLELVPPFVSRKRC